MSGQEYDEHERSVPEAPDVHPERTVDDLEEKITGHRAHQDRGEENPDGAAFEQDIDPAEADAEAGGHTGGEPTS